MNFALILFLLSLISGVIYIFDVVYWSKKRAANVKAGWLIEYSRSFFPVFFTVFLLRSFLIEPFRIPSGSLVPTLLVGDFIAVNKFAYGIRLPILEKKIIPLASPKIGEIAIFRWPPNPKYDFIKRVVGIPGDKVSYHNKKLIINGKEAVQKFIGYTTDESSGKTVAEYRENLNGVEHYIYVNPEMAAQDFDIEVPAGQYFMMGDNRDSSADSRYWGFVGDNYLRGKALIVWMSWNGQLSKVRWTKIGKIIV